MALRVRGQEGDIQVTIDGVTQEGSFFHVENFTETPLTDNVRTDFLGEVVSDVDQQHHGWDVSFDIQNSDAAAVRFMQDVATRSENGEKPPQVMITWTQTYRDVGVAPVVKVYQEGVLKVGRDSMGGRRSYIVTSFEGAFKKRELITV